MRKAGRISFIDPMLDEDEWEHVVSDGIVGEFEHDVAHAIAYLEGIADWLCSPLGPASDFPSVAGTPRLGWLALRHSDCAGIYGGLEHYLEAAALLRDGWRPNRR